MQWQTASSTNAPTSLPSGGEHPNQFSESEQRDARNRYAGELMSTPVSDDTKHWHRLFAVDSNNEAWQRTLDEPEHRDALEILRHAYVAAYHWSQCGTAVNEFRANILLAHAHAFCGHGQTALEYVARYREYLDHNTVETWEKPFALMVHAQAAFADGDLELHKQMYNEEKAFTDLVEDPNDRAVIAYTWANIPKP